MCHVLQTGAAGTGEQPNSNFVVFVKHLLNSPVEREHFFQVSVDVAHSAFSVYHHY